MTLDEAIKHCEEVAEELEEDSRLYAALEPCKGLECKECASEHRQLAEWLIELKKYREKDRYNNYDICLGGFHDN